MAILINEKSQILIQGMTGEEGSKAARQMIQYGTNVVCGVTPGKGGLKVENKPIYNTVKEALENHPQINVSVLYVPPMRAKSALIEAIEEKIPLIICITENIPIHDFLKCNELAKKNNVQII